jgi:hypothetical protein
VELPKTTTRDDFEFWLADMDDALDAFIASLPPVTRSRMDYSIASLDALELWILENWFSPREMLEGSQVDRVGGAARYIGEVIRKNVGGHWDIDLENKRNAYFGLPVVTDYSQPPTPECPLTLVTASADRRSGRYLSTIVENMKRRYGSKPV